MLERPPFFTNTVVYSNQDHELNEEIATLLETEPSVYGFHAAWDYCGYVWCTSKGTWVDQVWKQHQPVADVLAPSITAVIANAISMYGSR